MEEKLLGTSFYNNNKIKIYSIALISLLLSSIICYFITDYMKLNDYKEKWTIIYNKNIEILSSINSKDDIATAIKKSDYLIAEAFNSINDTNDDYEEGDIYLYNRLVEGNKYLKEIFEDLDSQEESFLKSIYANIDRNKTTIKSLQSVKRSTLLDI